jgi:hypothetical protein
MQYREGIEHIDVVARAVASDSFSRLALVFTTAPLGLVGATGALLISNRPFGFVALLRLIALAGMIMRNTVILVDQIDRDIAAGHGRRRAIIDATVRRARPVILTALAAILGMNSSRVDGRLLCGDPDGLQVAVKGFRPLRMERRPLRMDRRCIVGLVAAHSEPQRAALAPRAASARSQRAGRP